MEKKYIILVLIVIVAIVAVASYALINTDFNNALNTTENSTNNTNHGGDNIAKNNTTGGVLAVQSGPSSGNYGKNISIKWTVTNKESKPITGVNGTSQNFDYNFGTINAGQSKSVSFTVEIPSLDQVKNDFGDSATVSNPFIIGGFHLSYNLDGKLNEITSNSLSIPL